MMFDPVDTPVSNPVLEIVAVALLTLQMPPRKASTYTV
jgi:hypothetical protein